MHTEEGPTDPAERLAELMAWHGMARYAEPDDLAAHVRSAPSRARDEEAPEADGGLRA